MCWRRRINIYIYIMLLLTGRDAKCLAIAITHICHGLNIPTLQGWDLRSVSWSFVYFMYYTVKTLQFSDNNYVLRRKLCLHAKNLTLSRARLVITRTDGSTSPCCWPVRWQTKIDFLTTCAKPCGKLTVERSMTYKRIMRYVFFRFWENFIHSLTCVKFANYCIIKFHLLELCWHNLA